jgi:hypothetical protein
MYSPPPPPPVPPPVGPPASQQVQTPALALMIVAGIGAAFGLLSLVMNVAGVGMSGLSSMGGTAGGPAEQYAQYMTGGVGIASAIFSMALYGFVFWSAMKMKQLRKWTISMVGSIGAMLPCSCCCIIGLPIGIWSLIVLMKPEVKAAFSD